MSSREVKEYLSHHHISPLLESLLTGLLYHRPEDPVGFLKSCLIRTGLMGGPGGISWDTFIHPNTKPSITPGAKAASPSACIALPPAPPPPTPQLIPSTPPPPSTPPVPLPTPLTAPSASIPSKLIPLHPPMPASESSTTLLVPTTSPEPRTTNPQMPPQPLNMPPSFLPPLVVLQAPSTHQILNATPPTPPLTTTPPPKARGTPAVTRSGSSLAHWLTSSGLKSPAVTPPDGAEPKHIPPPEEGGARAPPIDGGEPDGNIQWKNGGPGSGKGSQAAKLSHAFALRSVSLDDLLRRQLLSSTSPSRRWDLVSHMMGLGELEQQEDSVSELKRQLAAQGEVRGFVVDGFPRDVHQALSFQDQVGPPDLVMLLLCSNETLRCRLQRRAAALGLLGDGGHALQRRLDTFHRDIVSITRYYRHLHLLAQVDANQDEDVVFADLSLLIKEKLSVCRR